MNWKSFGLGFLACYAIAGIAQAKSVLEIPATTMAGAVYVGVIWAPFNLLPKSWAFAMTPEWVFDFDSDKEYLDYPAEEEPQSVQEIA